jgi:hypothetical protein
MARVLTLLALALAVAGCDLRPLARAALYGASDGGDAAPVADDATQATDAAPADAGPAAGDAAEADAAADAGTGMLSGVVVDACTGRPLGAKVGIADRKQCSDTGKGYYFFPSLPVGTLRLAAMKDGYDLFSGTVEVAPGGAVQDIHLTRDCSLPPPADVACTCLDPGCG